MFYLLFVNFLLINFKKIVQCFVNTLPIKDDFETAPIIYDCVIQGLKSNHPAVRILIKNLFLLFILFNFFKFCKKISPSPK